MPYASLNYMNTDRLFSKEQIMIRDSVRKFVDNEVIPILQQANRKEVFPKQLIAKYTKIKKIR